MERAYRVLEPSNGLVDVPGFAVAAVHCDVRGKGDGRLDLALVRSEADCTAAGVFTCNALAAAPVRLGREQLKGEGSFRGIVINSGNANACTGREGLEDARLMRCEAARRMGCEEQAVFVCSTGRIGERLPMDRIRGGLFDAESRLSSEPAAGKAAADAILTSDTQRKVRSYVVETPAGEVRLSGMAKGAGMIQPDMATMLAFICTDAQIEQGDLHSLLLGAARDSFNSITVDGDESTNDTVLLLANGTSGISLDLASFAGEAFKEALFALCLDLALMIVGDGEKITKVVEISIRGASSADDADRAARAIGNSLLVKASWYGNDPNWGRVMDALGYSGARVEERSVSLFYARCVTSPEIPVFLRGKVASGNRSRWKEIVSEPRFCINVDLGKGTASRRLWSTDLTEGYVAFNKSE
ncbi:MAG TPA: bifunctional glutamate N-acetyltransferase/amino-acid acetyltransferase ArgJ [Oceanipulchritudo sp.]|nr:bifunctional glutamate N-acetyltransferase/amino-acid acetyltransferase ArgJ [Oceanipulchritudo sp.]